MGCKSYTPVNSYTVGIRCYSVDFDSTTVFELYPDGNMMRVCVSSPILGLH